MGGPVNKLPPEVHRVHGTKGMNQGVFIPEELKVRIPFAEWANDPSLFSRERFISETADYLYKVYGIGTDQDRHTLMLLADQMQIYVEARLKHDKNSLVVKINNGKTLAVNPYIKVANMAMDNIIKLMNELGLTPKSRLAANKLEDESPMAAFMKGWDGGTAQ